MKSVRPGLSLLEVILAILIVGISVTSLLGLQGTLVRIVFSGHSLLERLGFIRSFFVIADKDNLFKKTSQKKILEDPRLTMTYLRKRPVSASLKRDTYLVVEQVDAEWQTPFGLKRESLARHMFRPKKENSA